jgi:hypothetical protein
MHDIPVFSILNEDKDKSNSGVASIIGVGESSTYFIDGGSVVRILKRQQHSLHTTLPSFVGIRRITSSPLLQTTLEYKHN